MNEELMYRYEYIILHDNDIYIKKIFCIKWYNDFEKNMEMFNKSTAKMCFAML